MAEEERRRKQAEEQEQLQGLYRQQEETLRKKRPGGGGGSARRSSVGDVENDGQEDDARAPAYGGPALSQASTGGYSGLNVVAMHQTPRRSNAADIDDLPAGAQARAEILQTNPRGGDGRVSAPSPSQRLPSSRSGNSRADRPYPGESVPVASPPPRARFGGGARLAVERGHNTDSVDDSSARMQAGGVGGRVEAGGQGLPEFPPAKRELFRGSVLEEPQLRTHSSLMPVSSESLFSADDTIITNSHTSLDRSGGGILRTSALSMAWSDGTKGVHAENRAASSANPYDALIASAGGPDLRRETATAASAPHTAAAPPQDEMDAFVTSWQTEHLRRRNRNHGLAHEREQEGGFAPAISPRPPLSISPPRDALRSSRARSSTSGRGGAWGPPPELEESLAATSRLMDLPRALPLPPTAAAGSGRTESRSRRSRPERGIDDAVGDGADACDRSLTSDSVLYYLTKQHQEDKALAKGSDSPSGRGESEGMPSLRGKCQMAREATDGGNSVASSNPMPQSEAAAPAAVASQVGVASAGQIDDDGEEPMSPLTRLLAATDVRLGNGNGDCILAADSNPGAFSCSSITAQ